jgi:hypothetical protein
MRTTTMHYVTWSPPVLLGARMIQANSSHQFQESISVSQAQPRQGSLVLLPQREGVLSGLVPRHVQLHDSILRAAEHPVCRDDQLPRLPAAVHPGHHEDGERAIVRPARVSDVITSSSAARSPSSCRRDNIRPRSGVIGWFIDRIPRSM